MNTSNRILAIGLLAALAFSIPSIACDFCGDTTAIRSVAGTGAWSDAGTWEGGVPPAAGQQVIIAEGSSVILDTATPPLASLTIRGILRLSTESATALTSDWVMVMGADALFEAGTEDHPHPAPFTLTLTGSDRTANVTGESPFNSGTKFLMAMEGGTIEMHGASHTKRSFTLLDGSVAPGDNELLLAHTPTGWQPGDQICIAPSGFDPFEAELVTITAIDGKRVTFDPPLQYPHYGELQTFHGTVVDQRAEVGLLTRNLVIQGDEAGVSTGFGGHVMIMLGGNGRFQGVEFRRMGQRGLKGRYPLHWHLIDRTPGATGTGQWVRHCSFHHTFQRAVNIHGTNGVLVEHNVAYDIQNHAYVLGEDGDETGNIARYNLAMLVRTPLNGEFAFGTANDNTLQNEDEASGFWSVNADQTIIGNHVAGVERGNGITIDVQKEATPFVDDGRASIADRVVIAHNVLHTISNSHGFFHAHMYHDMMGFGVLTLGRFDLLDGFIHCFGNTIYKCKGGAFWFDHEDWAHANTIADCTAAAHAVMAQFTDNVVIGYTANRRGINGLDNDGPDLRGASGFEQTRDAGHWMAQVIGNNRFIGLNLPGLRIVDGMTWSDGAQTFGNEFLEHTGPRYHRYAVNINPAYGAIVDRDGHLGQTGEPTMITMDTVDADSVERAEMHSFLTPLGEQDDPYYFRGWMELADGQTVAPGAEIRIRLFNVPTEPQLRQVTIYLDGEAYVMTLPEDATSTTFTFPADLPEGWYRVTLVNHYRPIHRLFIRVGTDSSPLEYADWAARKLGHLPPIDRWAESDANGNGQSNFGEFALGALDQQPLFEPGLEGEGPVLTLEYNKPALQVDYYLLYSPDLNEWEEIETPEGFDFTTGLYSRAIQAAAGASSGFVRIGARETR